MQELISVRLKECIRLKQKLLEDDELLQSVSEIADEIVRCLKSDSKLVLCGNGGSASDALHFSGEIMGRFQRERRAWPAVVLNADVASMTSIANDYGYERVFSRQAEGHVKPGDVFIGISTSGNSVSILNALKTAKGLGAVTVAFTGGDGGKIREIAQYSIVIPSKVTARIQECHIALIHILCELVENGMEQHE